MSETKRVMLYKSGCGLRKAELAKLEAAGFLCIHVNEFDAVSFPISTGMPFIDAQDKIGVMILKAASDSISFEGRLGALIVAEMKRKAGITKP